MADAAVDLQASNLFGLHANFNTQTSSTSNAVTNVQTMDEVGNVSCQRSIGGQTNYTQSATYCGSDFVTDMGVFIAGVGGVQGVGAVESVTINMTAGAYATVDIAGHQHDTNPHALAPALGVAGFSNFFSTGVGEPFEDWDGFGVPDYLVSGTGSDATPSSMTITMSVSHVDKDDGSGDHFVGVNLTPAITLTTSYEGIPTANTIALLEADLAIVVPNILIDSVDYGDSNSDFDTFSWAGHANVDIIFP